MGVPTEDEFISYQQWGLDFFAEAVSQDRILGAVNNIAGQPIDFGPMGVGPGKIAKVRAYGEIGAASARALAASPWKVALIASSSWSHSFLTTKHGRMYPDVDSDKRYYHSLCSGDWETWRTTTLDQAESRGHHELLNWFCLAGAMSELQRKPDEASFLESWITNSSKVFATFRPDSA